MASLGADESFYTASLVKLLIALDALHTGGWHAPSARLDASLTEMISASHDGVADALWDSGGRSAIVTVYRSLTQQVPPEASGPILDALAAATNPAADGFPQYFGIPDGLPGGPWAAKQGWMKIRRAVVLNTSGLVASRYVVVLLAEFPLSTSHGRARAALTAGAAAVAPGLAS
ncbi:hypothetical protein LWP59_29925 [Amycolatopsis acidiphila]|uniref:Serine hydrolase n=1 Tax=Amycolatopsis acidiphila TaxID=715473 RepID=A0A557ZYN3_9PSEU|nr:hypothetical protein [Amycolatopsis acidiphila]TVT17122.1 hypothetical protein FNH06_32555 [Amycolatopsis acidiphila]UIJ58312.1 hypothetical protein LWP59_29925 [Amycolatopsis acidiphila]GHG95672.1 hypothetical protein GCM10017788_74350 [Amycolatopsis acidiphila]